MYTGYAVRARLLPIQELAVEIVEFDLELLACGVSEFGEGSIIEAVRVPGPLRGPYFALSILWRAAVHSWRLPDGKLREKLSLGGRRIAELEPRSSSPEVANELDTLAGRRFWNGRRDPLTSAVEVTDTAIELTLDWLRRESAARAS